MRSVPLPAWNLHFVFGTMAEEQRLAFLRTVLHPDGPEYQRLDEGAGCEGPQHC